MANKTDKLTWRSRGEIGNLSLSSVVHIRRDTLETRSRSGRLAMGPGFCAELRLLRWQ